MTTRITDYTFVLDNIHRIYKISVAKLQDVFVREMGWQITDKRVYGDELFIEWFGRRGEGDEIVLIPDYASDLEALRPAMEESKLIVGPEYAWFDERNKRPSGWTVYARYQDIYMDIIDGLGSTRALAISQSMYVSIMLAHLQCLGKKIELEALK